MPRKVNTSLLTVDKEPSSFSYVRGVLRGGNGGEVVRGDTSMVVFARI